MVTFNFRLDKCQFNIIQFLGGFESIEQQNSLNVPKQLKRIRVQ